MSIKVSEEDWIPQGYEVCNGQMKLVSEASKAEFIELLVTRKTYSILTILVVLARLWNAL